MIALVALMMLVEIARVDRAARTSDRARRRAAASRCSARRHHLTTLARAFSALTERRAAAPHVDEHLRRVEMRLRRLRIFAPSSGASTSSGVGHARGGPSRPATTTRLLRSTNGRYGANSRSRIDSADEQRAVGRGRPLPVPEVAVAARLHQLEVVVAEGPEERLGPLAARARSRRLSSCSVASATSAARVVSMPRSSGSRDRAARLGASPARTSTRSAA